MTKLTFLERDRRELIEILIQAVQVASIEGRPPEIIVDGKTYASHELMKVAALLPDEPMQPHHQEKIDRMFTRKQHGYRRTGYNLAHKAFSVKSPAKKAAAIAVAQSGADAIFAARQAGRFSDRGFSDRTVKALIARGIEDPERLLFATEAELKKIPVSARRLLMRSCAIVLDLSRSGSVLLTRGVLVE